MDIQNQSSSFNVVTGGKTYLSKWINSATGSTPDWVIVIRYTEVLLNYAEALARQNSSGADPTGLALVNAIRKRSDATTTLTAATSNDLINLILTERRIELLGEGFRTSDVTRTGASFSAKGAVTAVAPSSTNYIWPIPQNELLYNSAMVQNPGY